MELGRNTLIVVMRCTKSTALSVDIVDTVRQNPKLPVSEYVITRMVIINFINAPHDIYPQGYM